MTSDPFDVSTCEGMGEYILWVQTLSKLLGQPRCTCLDWLPLMTVATHRAYERGLSPDEFMDLPLSDPIWT